MRAAIAWGAFRASSPELRGPGQIAAGPVLQETSSRDAWAHWHAPERLAHDMGALKPALRFMFMHVHWTTNRIDTDSGRSAGLLYETGATAGEGRAPPGRKCPHGGPPGHSRCRGCAAAAPDGRHPRSDLRDRRVYHAGQMRSGLDQNLPQWSAGSMLQTMPPCVPVRREPACLAAHVNKSPTLVGRIDHFLSEERGFQGVCDDAAVLAALEKLSPAVGELTSVADAIACSCQTPSVGRAAQCGCQNHAAGGTASSQRCRYLACASPAFIKGLREVNGCWPRLAGRGGITALKRKLRGILGATTRRLKTDHITGFRHVLNDSTLHTTDGRSAKNASTTEW